MGQFLEKLLINRTDTKQPSVYQKVKTDYLKSQHRETSVPNSFTTEFPQILEGKIKPSLHSLFQKRGMSYFWRQQRSKKVRQKKWLDDVI